MTTDWEGKIRRWRRLLRTYRKLVIALVTVNTLVWILIVRKYLSEILTSTGNAPPIHYLVNTPGCQIIQMDPFSPVASAFRRESGLLHCKPPVVILEDEMLKFSPNLTHYNDARCCYQEIQRVTPPLVATLPDEEKNVTYSSPCMLIPPSGIRLPAQFVRVTCNFNPRSKMKPEHYYYAKPFPLERHSKETRAKEEYWKTLRANGQTHGPPSVLIVLLGHTSQNDVIRSLHQTRSFLLHNDFVELRGYSRIKDNAVASLLAALTGLEYTADSPFEKQCFDLLGYLDDCPIIWKNFSRRNYVTGFIEDNTVNTPLHSVHAGFRQPPTDYYGRPLTAALNFTEHVAGYVRSRCVGGDTETGLVMNYTLDFLRATRLAPYFFIAAFSTLTRVDANNLKPWDPKFKNFWEQAMALSNDHPYDPLMIFLSDEGSQFGQYRTTAQGYYESNQPFAFVRMPSTLRMQFPNWYQNLRKNAHSLTSPYDLHATLEDVLLGTSGKPLDYTNLNWMDMANRTVYSLFEEIPPTRTCELARIPKEHCNCGVIMSEEEWTEHEMADELIDITVQNMNKRLSAEIENGTCREFDKESMQLLYMWKTKEGHFGGESKGAPRVNYSTHILGMVIPEIVATFEAVYSVMDNHTVLVHHIKSTSTRLLPACLPVDERGLQNLCLCRDNELELKKRK